MEIAIAVALIIYSTKNRLQNYKYSIIKTMHWKVWKMPQIIKSFKKSGGLLKKCQCHKGPKKSGTISD